MNLPEYNTPYLVARKLGCYTPISHSIGHNMADLWRTISERHRRVASALGQHIEISLIALMIAVVIAIPLAVWVQTHPKNRGSAAASDWCFANHSFVGLVRVADSVCGYRDAAGDYCFSGVCFIADFQKYIYRFTRY